jgi:hypothetical protein
MMSLFDFLYYSIAKAYAAYKEKGAQSSSAGVIGGFQTINILTILMLIGLSLHQKLGGNKVLAIAIFLVFQVTTYIRYIYKEDNSIESIERKWLSKSEFTRKRLRIYLWLYGILSVLFFFGLAIYLGSKKW